MSLLSRNLQAVALAAGDEAAELLRTCGSASDFEPVTAKSGATTARLGATYLHSPFDPEREARRLVEAHVTADTVAALFLGVGLGYHIRRFASQHPSLPFAVIDPDPALIRAAMEVVDMTGVIPPVPGCLVLGQEAAAAADPAEALPPGDLAVIRLRSVYEKHASYFADVEETVRRVRSRRRINLNTLERFGELWVTNLLRNIGTLLRHPGVRELFGLFSGYPALVLAGGPSLDPVMPLLDQFRERMLIVAVDTALSACMSQGIEPDFAVTVDPQYWNSRYLDRMRLGRTLLIAEPSTHPVALRRFAGRCFFTGSFFPLGELFESVVGDRGRIGAGGSVATSAWDATRQLGACPIFMAGLDLGFPGMRTHGRGMFFETLMLLTGMRTLPSETQSYRYLQEAAPVRMQANDGTTVLTDARMLMYRNWFEAQLHANPEARTENLSPQGLHIPGMPLSDIHRVLDLEVIRPELDERLARATDLVARFATDAPRMRSMVEVLGRLDREIGAILVAARDGVARTRALGDAIRSNAPLAKHLQGLEDVDRRILSTSATSILGFLMQPLVHSLTSAAPPVPDQPAVPDQLAVVDRSLRLYTELVQSAEFHRAVLGDSLSRLEQPRGHDSSAKEKPAKSRS